MAQTYGVEPKVKVQALVVGILAFLGLALTNLLTQADNQLLLEFMPDTIETVFLPVVLAGLGSIGGYLAKHQYRASETTPVAPEFTRGTEL